MSRAGNRRQTWTPVQIGMIKNAIYMTHHGLSIYKVIRLLASQRSMQGRTLESIRSKLNRHRRAMAGLVPQAKSMVE